MLMNNSSAEAGGLGSAELFCNSAASPQKHRKSRGLTKQVRATSRLRIALGKFEGNSGLIRIVDLVSGTTRQVPVQEWTHLDSVGWSADGKSLFVTNWSSKGGSILRVALSGKAQLLHTALGMELERPLPSPDGHYLAYGEVTTISNAWMIQNF